MADAKQHNLQLLATVARSLGDLRDEVVFLGGVTTALLITDPAAASIRPTRDVDAIIEVVSISEYQTRLRDRLLSRGFREDTEEGAPLCRWIVEGIKVDIMPTDPTILGFSNRWYPDAVRHYTAIPLFGGPEVRVVTAPYFLGTKLEAFRNRGEGDFQGSHDLEDFVAVVDGRIELEAEVAVAAADLRAYFADYLGEVLQNRGFIDSLPGHLLGDMASQARLPMITARLNRLAGI